MPLLRWAKERSFVVSKATVLLLSVLCPTSFLLPLLTFRGSNDFGLWINELLPMAR